MTDNVTGTRKRVKLYMLNDERQWDDKGTGHVSSAFVEKLGGIALIVVSEADGTVLLESKIQCDTAYQKQQETLIVWSEGESQDLALSFQEKAGCEEIWEKICNVQGKDPSVEITQEVVDESEGEEGETDGDSSACGSINNSTSAVELPPCELSRLEELSNVVSSASQSIVKRDRLTTALERHNYIRKLCSDIFHQAEDLNDVESLHHLHDILRSIIFLNKQSLFELIFAEDIIMDVIGILEYEPQKPKANHRDFLKNRSHFREVLPIHKAEIKAKIHQTYKIQYIHECILPTPSLFDDNQFSSLTTLLYFNKIDIINSITDNDKFLTTLFHLLSSDDTSIEQRLDLSLFLKELCSFTVILNNSQKESFFKTLLNHHALSAVTVMFLTNSYQIKMCATDIFNVFIEFSPVFVREFLLKETGQDQNLLINVVIDQMCNDSDPELGGALTLANSLRILIDPETMLANNSPMMLFQRPAEKTEFLRFFYHRAMPYLTEPLFANTKEEYPVRDDYRTAQLLYHILDLLSFCIEHHSYHVKNLVLARDLIRRVLILLRSSHSFLVLGALRLFRRVVGLKDEFYNRYLTKNALFRPIVQLFVRNGQRYNLINSAVIELFEFIRSEDIRSLIFHVIDNHWEALRDTRYVTTFRGLHMRYEQMKDRDASRNTNSPTMESSAIFSTGMVNSRYRRDPRAPDEDEEHWFDNEEEEEEIPLSHTALPRPELGFGRFLDHRAPPTPPAKMQHLCQQQSPSLLGSPTSSQLESTSSSTAVLTPVPLLVDYPDEEDDDQSLEPPAMKRARTVADPESCVTSSTSTVTALPPIETYTSTFHSLTSPSSVLQEVSTEPSTTTTTSSTIELSTLNTNCSS